MRSGGYRPAPEHDPRVRAAFRRQVWLEIYLPLMLAAAGVGVALALSWRGLAADAGPLSSLLLAMLLLPVMVFLIPLIVLTCLALVGVTWGMGRVGGLAAKAQSIAVQVSGEARRVSEAVTSPVSGAGAVRAAWSALRRWIRFGSY